MFNRSNNGIPGVAKRGFSPEPSGENIHEIFMNLDETLYAAEKSLGEDWLRQEEDEAWAYLQI
jgi:hypothetical protein